jgi:hypothetical protein
MKLLSTLSLFILLGFSSSTFAQNTLYLGGELLSPVGVTAKADINEEYSLTSSLGFYLSEGNNNARLEITLQRYLPYEDISVESGELLPYAGVGLAFYFSDVTDEQIALRVPVGLEYKIEDTPFEIYMDVGPYLNIVDSFSFSFDSSLGFRYKF